MGRFVTSATPSLTDQWIERTSGNSVSTSISRSRSNRSPRRGHELDERLARVPPLAHDEMAQVALVRLLVVGRQLLLARPLAHPVADRVAEVGRQPAASRSRAPRPSGRPCAGRASGPSASARTSTPSCCGSGTATTAGTIGSSGEVDEPGEPLQRVARPTAASRRAARRSRDPGSGSRRRRGSARTARRRAAGPASSTSVTIASAWRRCTFVTRARTVSPGRPRAHEDDEAVEARDAVPAEGERVDRELELLVSLNGGGHALGQARAAVATWSRTVTPAAPREAMRCRELLSCDGRVDVSSGRDRVRGPSSSQKKMPCHVPSASSPSSQRDHAPAAPSARRGCATARSPRPPRCAASPSPRRRSARAPSRSRARPAGRRAR